jgi:hypothetical protein
MAQESPWSQPDTKNGFQMATRRDCGRASLRLSEAHLYLRAEGIWLHNPRLDEFNHKNDWRWP